MIQTRISGAQAAALLFLSRMFALLIAPSGGRSGQVGGGLAVLAALCSFLFQLALFFPGWLLMKRHPGQNFAEAAAGCLGKAGRLVSVLLWAVLVLLAGMSAAEFDRFLVSAVYEQAPKVLFALLFLAAAVYGAWLGLEAFGRYAYFGLTIFLLLAISLCCSLAGDFQTNELFAQTAASPSSFWGTAWSMAAGDIEILCFFLLLPNLRTGKTGDGTTVPAGKHLFFIWNGLYTLTACGFILLTAGVLGGSPAMGHSYPFYTLACAAEGQLFARTDAVHMSMWGILGLLRCCLLLYCGAVSLRCAATASSGKNPVVDWIASHRTAVTAAAAVLAAIFAAGSPKILNALRSAWGKGIPLSSILVVLPSVALLAGAVASAKNRKENASHEKTL